jgi:sporulation protein YlmC with PRC-barrel domain
MIFGKDGLLTATSVIALLFGAPVVAAGDMGKSEMHQGARIQATELVGKDLRTTSGNDIGRVESVIIDHNGEVEAVIVDVEGKAFRNDGFLGEDTGRNEPDD